ncbi:MAG: ABC transporter substrate-binding protein [Anaerolineales bacterium]|nr:ABC transporter substrate-binding protein [Anaerolineales bacterium]
MSERIPWRSRVMSGFALAALVLAACAPAAAPTQAPVDSVEPTAAPSAEKPVIKLAENNWTGSRINISVAKLLLEQELGYTVELVTIDENQQWAALAAGDLSASLEVWPSGHAENVAKYIDEQKTVVSAGALGVEGQIGWFIPTYMLTDHPELATWEGFQDPANAALFKTAETGDAGQFLGGDPSWVQYDEQIITNLGLNLKVVYAGSEEAILAQLDSVYSRQDPILMYFYRPHSAFARYDLTKVELPANSAECYAKAEQGGVDCDYPTDGLFKIAWSGLAAAAPDAYQLISSLNYSTEDQIGMIAAVDTDGKTPEEAAQAWIDAHPDVWKAWVGQ